MLRPADSNACSLEAQIRVVSKLDIPSGKLTFVVDLPYPLKIVIYPLKMVIYPSKMVSIYSSRLSVYTFRMINIGWIWDNPKRSSRSFTVPPFFFLHPNYTWNFIMKFFQWLNFASQTLPQFVDPVARPWRGSCHGSCQIGFKRISEAYSVLRDPEKRAECAWVSEAPLLVPH